MKNSLQERLENALSGLHDFEEPELASPANHIDESESLAEEEVTIQLI